MKVRVEINPVSQVAARLGLDPGGKAQRFHTNNVMRRIQKFMPFRTGATIKLMIARTDINNPEIVLEVPYAKYLYYGKVMEGAAPKKVTDIPLQYTKTKNPDAGPYWDRKLAAEEGDVIAQELEAFIRNGGSV